MEENKEGTQQAAQEAYVRQLAELSARVLHMTEEQKQRNAAKIEELNKRVAALPPALRGLYAQSCVRWRRKRPRRRLRRCSSRPLLMPHMSRSMRTAMRMKKRMKMKCPHADGKNAKNTDA